MVLIYKTISGEIGKVDKVDMLPTAIDVLIVKEFYRNRMRLPYTNKLVLDLNYNRMDNLYFKTDVLSVYRSPSGLFRFEMGRYFRVLKHLDMRGVTNMNRALMYTNISKICELDYKNVERNSHLFYGTQLTDIPPMKNYEHLSSDIFEDTNIPTHKEQTWRKLMDMNKQRCL